MSESYIKFPPPRSTTTTDKRNLEDRENFVTVSTGEEGESKGNGVTTAAMGEEGGRNELKITTAAMGEEGGRNEFKMPNIIPATADSRKSYKPMIAFNSSEKIENWKPTSAQSKDSDYLPTERFKEEDEDAGEQHFIITPEDEVPTTKPAVKAKTKKSRTSITPKK